MTAKQTKLEKQVQGMTIMATWQIVDGKPTSEYPATVTLAIADDASERMKKRGITPPSLMVMRDVIAEMIQEAHGRPDPAKLMPEARAYFAEHADALQATGRNEVTDDYYSALLAAVTYLEQIGLDNPLQFIAVNTGVKYATLRNRYYTAQRVSGTERRPR